jgi:hypothetical protein
MPVDKKLLELKSECWKSNIYIFNLFSKISIHCQSASWGQQLSLMRLSKKLLWFLPKFDKLGCLQIYDASTLFKICEQGAGMIKPRDSQRI